MDEKLFGVFNHKNLGKKSEFTRGFDDEFMAPHSRHTQILKEDVLKESDLRILAESDEAGLHIMCNRNKRFLFVQGHAEYDWDTLKLEYDRDINKGMDIAVPRNYFKDDNPKRRVVVQWSGHGNLFFANWLNYVYQETPYDLDKLKEF
jgi:homoserine O-succinyltransferase